LAGVDSRYGVAFEPLADGDRIPAGTGELRVVATPGHAPDHICLFEPESRTLFGGDLIVKGGTVMIPASTGGSLRQYLDSLQRVRALAPRRVLPAHGPPIDDPDALIVAYLAHRAQREQQVLAALAAGALDAAAIVSRVYGSLAPELVGAARESVTAHLLELETEGRVRRAGDEWLIVE
jgi:glyoxylase-like metal-dependent hydrolase (beta-lactamase superfamily II)